MLRVNIEVDKDINTNDIKSKVLTKYQKDVLFNKILTRIKKEQTEYEICDVLDIYDSLKKCEPCKSIEDCTQTMHGHHLALLNNELAYKPCKFQETINQKNDNYSKLLFCNVTLEEGFVNFSDIDITNERRDLLKYIEDIQDKKNNKGIYISGQPGVGKSYILNVILNEYLSRDKTCAIVFLNDLFTELKSKHFSYDFEIKNQVTKTLKTLKTVDVLFIDDIGSENIDAISRDDFLFPILDYRMKNKLLTYFSSNYDFELLKNHYSKTSSQLIEPIKGARIMERIRTLSDEVIIKDLVSRRQ